MKSAAIFRGYVRTTRKVIIIPHGPANQAIFGLVQSFRATMADLPRQQANNFQVAFSRSNVQGSCIISGGCCLCQLWPPKQVNDFQAGFLRIEPSLLHRAGTQEAVNSN